MMKYHVSSKQMSSDSPRVNSVFYSSTTDLVSLDDEEVHTVEERSVPSDSGSTMMTPKKSDNDSAGDFGNEADEADQDDDDEQNDADHCSSNDEQLDPVVRRRLLELLPDLMSAANYQRLVDEGHVRSSSKLDDDEVETGRALKPSWSALKNEQHDDNADNGSFCSSESMATPMKSLTNGQRETNYVTMTSANEASAVYACHICDFTCQSKTLFDEHMNNKHYVYRCSLCRYSAKTSGRLQRHMVDFHSGTRKPQMSNDVMKTTTSSTRRKFRCRRCDYVTDNQASYWCHCRQHINPKDLFECPACQFATRFKHHMMYHVLTHLDINPYSCAECGYPCKNKSMLKSHMKTHTNVYQYQCAFEGCSFVTKYCHAMNQHLNKYKNHRPADILNEDGSLPLSRHVTKIPANRRRGDDVINTQNELYQKNQYGSEFRSFESPIRNTADSTSSTSIPLPGFESSLLSAALPARVVTDQIHDACSVSLGTGWPSIWTAAMTAELHRRHHQSFAASAAAPTPPSISALCSMLHPSLLQQVPPSLPHLGVISGFMPTFMWPMHPITWTEQSGKKTTFPNSELSTRVPPIAAAKEHTPRTLPDWTFGRPLMTSPNFPRKEVKTPYSSPVLTPRTNHPYHQPASRLPPLGSRNWVEGSLTINEDKRCTKLSEASFSDSPIDLTKKKVIRTPVNKATETASNVDDERSSLATAKWHQPGRSDRNNGSDVTKELKRLQRTVSDTEYGVPAANGDGQRMEWAVPSSLSMKGGYQCLNESSPEFSGGGTGNSNGDRKQQTAAANKIGTPPTSDTLTSSMLPVARRLDTGFDTSNDRIHVDRDEDDDRWNSSSKSAPLNLISKIKHFANSGVDPVNAEMCSLRRTQENNLIEMETNSPNTAGRNMMARGSNSDEKTSKRKPTTKFECPCGVFYAHRDTYDVHMAFHYSQSEPFRCRICDRNYNGAVEFFYHVIRYPHDVTP